MFSNNIAHSNHKNAKNLHPFFFVLMKRIEVQIRIRRSIFGMKLPILTKKQNTPTGDSTNPKNFDLNKNLNLNLI